MAPSVTCLPRPTASVIGTSSSPSKGQKRLLPSNERAHVGQVMPGAPARAGGSAAGTSSRASYGQYCRPAGYSRWQVGQTGPARRASSAARGRLGTTAGTAATAGRVKRCCR